MEANRALRAALVQNDLLEARASLLHARVSLYEGELIDVTRHLEEARTFVQRAAPRFGATGARGASRPLDLDAAALQVDEAKRLVAVLATQTRALPPR